MSEEFIKHCLQCGAPEGGCNCIDRKDVVAPVQEGEQQNIPPLIIDSHAPPLEGDQKQALEQQWNQFWKLRQDKEAPRSVEVRIKAATLLHQFGLTRLGPNGIKEIFRVGTMSGEVSDGEKPFYPEDNETHYCADFFASTEERSVAEYIQWANSVDRTKRLRMKPMESYECPNEGTRTDNDSVALVIDSNNPNLQSLMKYSGTGLDKGGLKDFPVRFPNQSERHKAVLVGIPANFIEFVIVGGKIKKDLGILSQLKEAIQEAGLDLKIVDCTGQPI